MRARGPRPGVWLLLLLVAGAVHAETLPVRGESDSRIRNATYEADQVYRLYGFVGYAIELIFEAGEAFVGAGGGDLEGVTIDAHANAVLVKPRAAIVATNLVIYTDRRAYRFDYSAEARRPNRPSDEVIYAVRFAYPDGAVGAGAAEAVGRELGAAKAAWPRNSDYWFCGHRSLRPTAASDDGVHTRLTFADAGGAAGDFRAKRRRLGVAPELLRGRGRRRGSPPGAEADLAPRASHRLHREPGL